MSSSNAKGYMKESKKIFFVEYVQKIAVQSQPNTYKVREKHWGAVQIQNKKRTARSYKKWHFIFISEIVILFSILPALS